MSKRPKHLDVKRDWGLRIEWDDATESAYEVGYLRKHSPSADAKKLREEVKQNPLTILPNSEDDGPLRIEDVEMVGNYAIRITFSDGHRTGIYSWDYLLDIDPQQQHK